MNTEHNVMDGKQVAANFDADPTANVREANDE